MLIDGKMQKRGLFIRLPYWDQFILRNKCGKYGRNLRMNHSRA
ncbi:hypothetical protein POPA111323_05725 [Polynucleobacter paneuropaeus]